MESIYDLIQQNPELYAWAFGLVNTLWIVFIYFNRQSHERSIERLKNSFQVKQLGIAPLISKLVELEEISGEAKEIVTSYRSTEEKKALFMPLYSKLNQLTGQLSKYPKLMQAIRDFNHFSSILVQDDPHRECRDEVLNFYTVLLSESDIVRHSVNEA